MAGAADYQRAKTYCPKGHPYDEQNTMHTKDGRACRTCRNEAERRRAATPEGKASARERTRKWRQKHHEKDLARHKKRREDERKWLESVRATGCIKCGETRSGCLDFHHRDPATKEFQIGKGVLAQYAKERIAREIAKCDILCSNCHRQFHYDDREINEQEGRDRWAF